MYPILKQDLVPVTHTVPLFIIINYIFLVDMMVTIEMIYTDLTSLQINGSKSEEMDFGQKVDTEHQRLLWVNACICLVVMTVPDS